MRTQHWLVPIALAVLTHPAMAQDQTPPTLDIDIVAEQPG